MTKRSALNNQIEAIGINLGWFSCAGCPLRLIYLVMPDENMKARIILTLLFFLIVTPLAYGNNGKSKQLTPGAEIRKPVIISTSYYDIDHDGKKERIEILINKGRKIIEKELWCGAGDRWEGDFIIRVRKGKKILFTLSLNKYMGEELSFYAPSFAIVFRDYNGDGDIDFNLGQYGICDGNEYWFFTIRQYGKIEPLPIEDGPLFIQGPNDRNSTDNIIMENNLIKNTSYDRDSDVEHINWHKWSGTKFVVAKRKEILFREPFKAFSIKREQLVGNWMSYYPNSENHGQVVLKSDGTFQANCKNGEAVICSVTGTWNVSNNHLIWLYDSDHNDFKKGQEDNNIILDFETDKFLLKEMSGELSYFTRSPK